MKMKTIDGAQALKLLEAARDTKGADHVYQKPVGSYNCLYVHTKVADGKTQHEAGCIVGHVLIHGLGIGPEAFLSLFSETLAFSYNEASIISVGLRERLRDEFGISLLPDAANVLYAAQRAQDTGAKWGDAVEEARAGMSKPKDEVN